MLQLSHGRDELINSFPAVQNKQLTDGAVYVKRGDKSCVTQIGHNWGTAFSNSILRTGRHYASFEVEKFYDDDYTANREAMIYFLGVMRPGKTNENASGTPLYTDFFQHFSRNKGHENSIQCCLYNTSSGISFSSDWDGSDEITEDITWEGSESMSLGDEIGILLDLDEGTLSVYKNGRKLGVMKRGLSGPYCWVASMWRGTRVTMKRGAVPPS